MRPGSLVSLSLSGGSGRKEKELEAVEVVLGSLLVVSMLRGHVFLRDDKEAAIAGRRRVSRYSAPLGVLGIALIAALLTR